MSEKNDIATMRNWSLRSIAGFRELLKKIRVHCPEVEDEYFRALHNLQAMEAKIREHQPLSEPPRPKMRRIFVS